MIELSAPAADCSIFGAAPACHFSVTAHYVAGRLLRIAASMISIALDGFCHRLTAAAASRADLMPLMDF